MTIVRDRIAKEASMTDAATHDAPLVEIGAPLPALPQVVAPLGPTMTGNMQRPARRRSSRCTRSSPT